MLKGPFLNSNLPEGRKAEWTRRRRRRKSVCEMMKIGSRRLLSRMDIEGIVAVRLHRENGGESERKEMEERDETNINMSLISLETEWGFYLIFLIFFVLCVLREIIISILASATD